MYQNHLDQAAADHEKHGKDGSWLRNHFQQKLGFTDAEFAPVRITAQQLESEMKPIDAQITTIALQDHAWLRLHGRSQSAGAPPGHAQVHQLGQTREALIQSKVDNLNQALGPKNASKFQYFIENEWAPHVIVRTMQKGPQGSAHSEIHKPHPWQEVRP
jgi:hypothetical protein